MDSFKVLGFYGFTIQGVLNITAWQDSSEKGQESGYTKWIKNLNHCVECNRNESLGVGEYIDFSQLQFSPLWPLLFWV